MMAGRIAATLCLAALFLAPAEGYQWPVEQKTVVATFGQSFVGGFPRGGGIAGKGAAGRPLEAGDLVFYRAEGDDPAGLPSGLGSYAVLEHGRNIRSLYGHVDLSPDILAGGRKTFGEADVIGAIGESGYTEGARLFLMVIDAAVGQIVNPYLILPPVEEKSRPVISNVTLSAKNASMRLPAPGPAASGTWEVSAQIYDPSYFVRYFCPTAPYPGFILPPIFRTPRCTPTISG